MKVALTIAGSDSGGGAGIQADIKAMQANGVFAASVITAVTAQNTQAVYDAYDLPVDVIEKQIDAVFDDIHVDAVKTGMLSSSEIIETVSRKLAERGIQPVVVDPVMISKSGYALLKKDAIETLKKKLLPLATIVTPNAHEAAHLTGIDVRSVQDAREAARRIFDMGPSAVIVKGGHLDVDGRSVDVLFDGSDFHQYESVHYDTPHTHGTGCTFASAIAANLAKGYDLDSAVGRAKQYVSEAIRNGLPIGHGHGPTHHFYFLEESGIFPVGAA